MRPSLIPLFISYFQNREMRVKHNGVTSRPRKQPGSGAQGASLGNHEFTSQTNNNANSVPKENRFKYVDDLATSEIINLLSIGLSSCNFKQHIPSDIPAEGFYIDPSNLKSQPYLDGQKNTKCC